MSESTCETKPKQTRHDVACKPKPRASAGPAEDDRFGRGPIARDLPGQIVGSSLVGDRVEIKIDRGTEHGARVGMEGYVAGPAGMLSELQIHKTSKTFAYAFVNATRDELLRHRDVVINPSTMPRAASLRADHRARIIKADIVGDRTQITIGAGTNQGVDHTTRGSFVRPNGSPGEDFEISGYTARNSTAYIHATFAEVQASLQVVLNPTGAAPTGGAPVQRRATGTPAARNVQQTARDGVSGAASMLPHLETIQRAFGRHDVSGVRAQIGGPAADAADALGASAYATGDRVAFGSSPDLHTAAHEAAHVVQQRHGNVGFQGLGDADDAFEHHADRVADAVVAGASAEALLDQIAAHAPANAGAVQRKTQRERNAERFRDQVDDANASRQAQGALYAAADVLRSESPRAVSGVVAPYAAPLASLLVAVTGKREGERVSGRERLAALDASVLGLRSAMDRYGSGPEQQEWLAEHVRSPLASRRSSLQFAAAHERVEASVIVDGKHVIDAKDDGDPEAQLASVKAALPSVLANVYTANEWVLRFANAHKGLDKAIEEMLAGKVPPQFGKLSSLAQLHSLLESAMGILKTRDNEKLLVEARNWAHWISSRADFAKLVVQLVGSTAAVASGIFAHVAKLSGNAELSLVLSGAAKKMSMGISDAVTYLEIVSSVATMFDDEATRQEKTDAGVNATSNAGWLIANKLTGADGTLTTAGTALGAAAFAIQMSYLELKYALELYWGASLGLVTGMMRPALERLHRDGLAVASSADALVKAQTLASTEKDANEREALRRVITVNARRLGEAVDRVIADALPPALEAGMANHPGGYPILVKALEPVKRHKGARTPKAAAAAGKVALERINWILANAPEIFFAQTRREGIEEVERYRKDNDRKEEEARQKRREGLA